MQKIADNVVTVLYDFQYTAKDKRLINVKHGEKLYLINKTNRDWWQVIRSCEERPFFVPAQYVVERNKQLQGQEQLKQQLKEDVEYQNLDFLKLKGEPNISKSAKPVPKTRTQLRNSDKNAPPTDKRDNLQESPSFDDDLGVSDNNNRMRNSYNLKNDLPKMERKQSVPLHKRKPLELGRTLSRSLERLAEEIKFEPKSKKVEGVAGSVENGNEVKVLSLRNKVESECKIGEKAARGIFRGSVRGKSRDAGVILSERDGKRVAELKQKAENQKEKTQETPLALIDRKPSKSRGNFLSSFKKRKPAYVLSTSWEGLDKLGDDLEKPNMTAFGLHRSRTFMLPEKPKPRKRLDAYSTMTFSTFKTNVTKVPVVTNCHNGPPSDVEAEEKRLPDENDRRGSEESVTLSGETDGRKLMAFAGRKTSLVRNRRVDASSARLRVPASPPPDISPLRDLGDGWGEFHSSDGRPYYFNRVTGERNLKPPRRFSNNQHGSKDSIASDFSSPVRSSPSESPKFPSGTSLDRLPFEGLRHRSRSSLDRLTPIEIPAIDSRTTPKSSPSYGSDRLSPLDNLPSDGEGLELSDHVLCDSHQPLVYKQPLSSRPLYQPCPVPGRWSLPYGCPNLGKKLHPLLKLIEQLIPRGYREEIEKGKDGQNRRCYVNVGTHEKYQTWPPRKKSSKEQLEKHLHGYKQWLEFQYGGMEKPFVLASAKVDLSDVIEDDTHESFCELPVFLRSPYQRRVSCDVFDEILQAITLEMNEIDQIMAIYDEKTRNSSYNEAERIINLIEDIKTKSGEFEESKGKDIFDDGQKREKPPVPPRRKYRKKSNERPVADESISRSAEESETYLEEHELLLMNRVTESSKDRRKPSTNRIPSQFSTDVEVTREGASEDIDQIVRLVQDGGFGSYEARILNDSGSEALENVSVKECLKKWETYSSEPLSKVAEKKIEKHQNVVSTKNLEAVISSKEEMRETELQKFGKSLKVADVSDLPTCDNGIKGETVEYAEILRAKDKPPVPPRKNLDKVASVELDESVIIEWSRISLGVSYEPLVLESKIVPFRPAGIEVGCWDSEEGEVEDGDEDMGVRSNSWTHAKCFPVCKKDIKDLLSDNEDEIEDEFEGKIIDDIVPTVVVADKRTESRAEEDLSADANVKWSDICATSSQIENASVSEQVFEALDESSCEQCSELNTDDSDCPKVSKPDVIDVVENNKAEQANFEDVLTSAGTECNNEDSLNDQNILDSSGSIQYVRLLDSSAEGSVGMESNSNSSLNDVPCENTRCSLKSSRLSKSLDVVCESILCKKFVEKPFGVPEDVQDWLSRLRIQAWEEDDFDKWYTSHNTDDLVYFYKENSNDSKWQLPEVYKDGPSTSGELYKIQRSATESAIPQESGSSVRLRKSATPDKEDGGRGRAAKTQSMIFDGKNFPLPAVPSEYRHCGVLNRTRFGKKMKKSWVTTFAVLFNDSLNFYKEEKIFRQKIAAPRASVSHPLMNAVIEPAGSLSKKKNCFKISWPLDDGILIQTDKKEEAEVWFNLIQNVINNIPRSPSPVPEPSPTSKVSRSKSVKAKPRGSIEDLTAAGGGENKNKISEYLKKFILRRPSSDALRLKGILKDEPVFGCSLEAITVGRIPRIPVFVQRCVEVIEGSEENMKTDGLYRASGNLSQVQKIRLQVDQNNLAILEQEEDVHVLSGSLKLFFRELKEPLIPFNLFKLALEASRNGNKKQKIKKLKEVINSLQVPNRDTLEFLLVHLLKVQSYKEFNRMHIANLAIVFGPTLVWGDEDSATMALDLMQQNLVVECLLLEFNNIFPL